MIATGSCKRPMDDVSLYFWNRKEVHCTRYVGKRSVRYLDAGESALLHNSTA